MGGKQYTKSYTPSSDGGILEYSQLILEVDGNNMIKAVYPMGPEVQSRPVTLPLQISEPIIYKGHENLIKWRSQDEVAIEVGPFNQPLVLHDLVDPRNVEVMVMKRNRVVIQGSSPSQIAEMGDRTLGLLGFPRENKILVYRSSSEKNDLAAKRLRRQGRLVDVHHEHDIVSEERAKELVATTWDIPTLEIMEMWVPDPSLPGLLKPGRRLIPHQEVFRDGTAAAGASNGHTQW